jgi:hypothetical protein
VDGLFVCFVGDCSISHGSGGYFVDDEDCFVFGFFAAVILGLDGYGYVLALLSICPG